MSNCEFLQKKEGKIPRLTNKTFNFDKKIADGYYSAKYFLKTAKILESVESRIVLLQFFQRKDNTTLCGIDEALALLKMFAKNYDSLEIKALNDGDKISAFEPVLTIEGEYKNFGFLEEIIDGILARRSSIATNANNLLSLLADNQEIIFMGDREDIYSTQPGDGYAVTIGGVSKVATDAMGAWTDAVGIGTIPHALIQNFNGDLIESCEAYQKIFTNEPLVALVDYNNDVIEDSLKVAHKFKDRLYAVRVDTSPTMVDKYFLQNMQKMGSFDPRGVNSKLIKALRESLNKEGFDHVKIIASGNFDYNKIKYFKEQQTPVDIYGVGSFILKINIGFTGDCVELNGQPQSKLGRRKLEQSKLKTIE